MAKDEDTRDKETASILTPKEADCLITKTLDTDLDEPEPLVKLLLVLYDQAQEPNVKDSIHVLMKAAYDNSIVHSLDFQEYLDAIRQKRDPLREARARRYCGSRPTRQSR